VCSADSCSNSNGGSSSDSTDSTDSSGTDSTDSSSTDSSSRRLRPAWDVPLVHATWVMKTSSVTMTPWQ
jgi:hypothetical protein